MAAGSPAGGPDRFRLLFLAEPLSVWYKLRPVDLIRRNQPEVFFDGGPDLARGSQKASNGLLDS